jgi:hypothetical protein
MSAPFWVDIIEDIVDEVRSDWTTRPVSLESDSPYYFFGHPREVVIELTEREQSTSLKLKRFPLIALIQDFDENMGNDQKILSSTSLRIIIAMTTDPDYDSAQRYDNTFRTILYPLYDLFIEKLIESAYFLNVGDGLGSHIKTDRPFWGRQEAGNSVANIGKDYVDAIEIRDLQLDLRISQKNC